MTRGTNTTAAITTASILDQLAPQAVEKRTHEVASLRAAAEATSQRFYHILLSASGDKLSLLDSISAALKFPAYFGRNLDALRDCLTDSDEGRVIVIEGLASHPEAAAILEVFKDAAGHYAPRGTPFRVLYS